MLLVACNACGRRELRGIRSIERLDNDSSGITVTIRCAACGHRCQILTGAGRSQDPTSSPAAHPDQDSLKAG